MSSDIVKTTIIEVKVEGLILEASNAIFTVTKGKQDKKLEILRATFRVRHGRR